MVICSDICVVAEQLGVWLLPAIERDASLALRLPLPMLCVLSLLQLSSSVSSTGVLFARLRKALAAGDSDVAVFFLSRLNSPSSASRLVALRALNACISTQQTPTVLHEIVLDCDGMAQPYV